MNRRQFLSASAAALTLSAMNFRVSGADQPVRRVGLIGSGWYGKADLLRLIQVAPVEVVSLCDADAKMLAGAADIVAGRQASKKKPRTYADYREMLKEKDLDIVLIATPDHWHALPMIAACEAGADLYVQKPVGVDVVECQAMLAAARKHKRVVQVGTQRRSTPHLIEARDRFIREGRLGDIRLVEVYCYYGMSRGQSPPNSDVPEGLDWDLWCGPAPKLPYNRMMHPRGWRSFMEFGNGIIGDMCIHMYDMVRWMMDLGWPKRISSSGGIYIRKNSIANIPDTQNAVFDHGNLQVVWQHRTWGQSPDPKYPWGATFYGDKGTLKCSVMSYDFTPNGGGEAAHKDVTYELEQYPEDKTEKDLERHVAPAIRGHMKDLLANIAIRGKPVADIEQGAISSACCILANNALKLGRTLTWDAEKWQVVNDDEANQLLRRPYRAPWKHPEA